MYSAHVCTCTSFGGGVFCSIAQCLAVPRKICSFLEDI